MTFRENLHYLMDCKGIQIKELSAMTGISENTIKSYLKENSAEPAISKAVLIADALNVSVDFLATGRESAKEKTPVTEFVEVVSMLKDFSASHLKIILALAKALKQNS